MANFEDQLLNYDAKRLPKEAPTPEEESIVEDTTEDFQQKFQSRMFPGITPEQQEALAKELEEEADEEEKELDEEEEEYTEEDLPVNKKLTQDASKFATKFSAAYPDWNPPDPKKWEGESLESQHEDIAKRGLEAITASESRMRNKINSLTKTMLILKLFDAAANIYGAQHGVQADIKKTDYDSFYQEKMRFEERLASRIQARYETEIGRQHSRLNRKQARFDRDNQILSRLAADEYQRARHEWQDEFKVFTDVRDFQEGRERHDEKETRLKGRAKKTSRKKALAERIKGNLDKYKKKKDIRSRADKLQANEARLIKNLSEDGIVSAYSELETIYKEHYPEANLEELMEAAEDGVGHGSREFWLEAAAKILQEGEAPTEAEEQSMGGSEGRQKDEEGKYMDFIVDPDNGTSYHWNFETEKYE